MTDEQNYMRLRNTNKAKDDHISQTYQTQNLAKKNIINNNNPLINNPLA